MASASAAFRSAASAAIFALASAGSLRAADAPASEPLPKADFVSAFNGKDLAGWKDAKDNKFWKVVDGVLVGSTPSFLGTNPGQVKSDTLHVGDAMPGLVGFELLDQEDGLGRELAKSLTADQCTSAIFAAKSGSRCSR